MGFSMILLKREFITICCRRRRMLRSPPPHKVWMDIHPQTKSKSSDRFCLHTRTRVVCAWLHEYSQVYAAQPRWQGFRLSNGFPYVPHDRVQKQLLLMLQLIR